MRALLITLLALLAASCARNATVTDVPSAPSATTPGPASTFAQLEASRDLDGNVVGPGDESATVVMVMASWCSHCRDEIAVFDRMRAAHPHVRWLAVNYKQHEEYDQRGNSESIRALARTVPWLRVVPADEALFTAVGRPQKIPSVLVFDHDGAELANFQREKRAPPSQGELDDLLRGR